jgi:hypothetical protein
VPSRLTTFGAVAVVALFGMVVPAFGGPSAISVAKKALKVANKANKKSTKAVLLATKGPKNESITSAKIANLTIKNEDISVGAVGSGKIANGAIRSVDVGDGQITNSKIADNAIGTGKIADGSVSAADLSAADIHGTIHGDAGAVVSHSCLTAPITLGGAQVGDVVFFTFTGDTPAPPGLTFEIVKVTAPNEGNIRFCNVTDVPSPAFDNVGIRVLAIH